MANRDEAPARSEGELFRTGLHPVSGASALGLAAFIAFIGALIVRHNDLSRSTDARIVLVCLALGGAALAGPLLRLRRSALVVTPGYLHLQLASWRTHASAVPVREIRAVDVRSGAVGRQLDFGTVTLAAGDDAVIVIHHVRAPLALRDALRRAGGRR
jgi:membrane protein YdbS with pleckstrin-like domain